MLETLSNLQNIILILLGFGLVIFIHELGHFLAAKWAGVRVHAFAIGFGPALLSYRKGMGLRRGSSERDVAALADEARRAAQAATPDDLDRARDLGRRMANISPTEYRLNAFPFGGYVKMLGQEDLDPNAASSAPDSYTRKPIWKRMVIISAGVVMNLILAAILYIFVFMAGLKAPAPIVGAVVSNSPAQQAGLLPGDIITTINGEPAETFADVRIAAAMARKGAPLAIGILRPSTADQLTLNATPSIDTATDLLDIGVYSAPGDHIASSFIGLPDDLTPRDYLDKLGLTGINPGARLTHINTKPITTADAPWGRAATSLDIDTAAAASNGAPFTLTFANEDGSSRTVSIQPDSELQSTIITIDTGDIAPREVHVNHLLGLAPPMMVESVMEAGEDSGLLAGDIFARIGDTAWPTPAEGIREIQSRRGKTIPVEVLRNGAITALTPSVSTEGQVGFRPDQADHTTILGALPKSLTTPAAALAYPAIIPGSRIAAINGRTITNFREAREAISLALAASPDNPITIDLDVPAPGSLTPAATESITLTPTQQEREEILALSWTANSIIDAFEPATITLEAANPGAALVMGIRETKRKVILTYITLQRLFEGSVKVKHLKGPVGITHIGAQMADQGFIYLIFFLALISANLAVINFLPLPIVDGGMFLMLCYEAIFRRPVPIAVQNALTMLGLVLIGAMFLTVTYYDLKGLIG